MIVDRKSSFDDSKAATPVVDSGSQPTGPILQDNHPIAMGLQQEPFTEQAEPDDLTQVLRQQFGFASFRPQQREICESVLAGQDTIAVLPTGSGKSLCYQLPGVLMSGITLVVSPLISLAKDQAEHLRAQGHAVAVLNSSRTEKQLLASRDRIERGEVKFVLTTPERLQRTNICHLLKTVGVSQIVIDETHCVVQWGHDFRPDYLALPHLRSKLGNPTLLALTATASADTVEEIGRALRSDDPAVIRRSVIRSNLKLEVIDAANRGDALKSLQQVLEADFTQKSNPPSTIVYCLTTALVDQLSTVFRGLAYHGKMKKAERLASQNQFMNGSKSLMFATSAFGLGIDKADIRKIIHMDLPVSVEQYYQQIGRAGRDGEPACCTLICQPNDVTTQKMFAAKHLPSSKIMTAHHTLTLGVEQFGDKDDTVSLADLKNINPLGTTTTRACLQLLASRGVVAPVGRGRWKLLQQVVAHTTADRLAEETRERSENRKVALQEMMDYSRSNKCRWQFIQAKFESVSELDRCTCDNCQ